MNISFYEKKKYINHFRHQFWAFQRIKSTLTLKFDLNLVTANFMQKMGNREFFKTFSKVKVV